MLQAMLSSKADGLYDPCLDCGMRYKFRVKTTIIEFDHCSDSKAINQLYIVQPPTYEKTKLLTCPHDCPEKFERLEAYAAHLTLYHL